MERSKLVELIVQDIISGLPPSRPRFIYIYGGNNGFSESVIEKVSERLGANVSCNKSRMCEYSVNLNYFISKYSNNSF